MQEIIITANDAGRRLDRFLRKYLPGAALSEIYKMIRKDVKVDGKRRDGSYMLREGDTLTLYLADEAFDRFTGGRSAISGDAGDKPGSGAKTLSKARRSFGIVYEDDDILVANKPFGLLTHGDSHEKKNHLSNQVKDYLIASGEFDPRSEKVFAPAPANRLDRNTTGLVLFGKNAAAMRELNRMIREDEVRKFYLTIACGEIKERLELRGSLTKDEAANKVSVSRGGTNDDKSKDIVTIVTPLKLLSFGNGLKATLCEVELVTGRTHQIRAHLASAGHPLAGDSKYSVRSAGEVNEYMKKRFGLSTQLLHACRLEFRGKTFEADPPERFIAILKALGVKHPQTNK